MSSRRRQLQTLLYVACLALLAACGPSNSEHGPLAAGRNGVIGVAGASGGVTGVPGTGTGSGTVGGGTVGGTAGVGGTQQPVSGAGTEGTIGGGSGMGGLAGMIAADPPSGTDCTATQTTEARLTTIDVTWVGTAAVVAGSGKVYAWTLWNLTYNGANATAEVSSCGAVLPELPRQAILGGGKMLIEYPTDIWDLPSVPKSTVDIQFSSAASNASFTSSINVVLGATLADPNAAWPASYTELAAVDVEGDGKPGFTSTPRDASGYQLPPTSLLGSQHADKLYLAIRNAMTTQGQRSSCDAHSGTVSVSAFDNHIVGCHVKETQAECAAADAKFIDDNRTKLLPASATYVAKVIAPGSTCADVRAAFPVQ